MQSITIGQCSCEEEQTHWQPVQSAGHNIGKSSIKYTCFGNTVNPTVDPKEVCEIGLATKLTELRLELC